MRDNSFSDFQRDLLDSIAKSLGISFEQLSGDYVGIRLAVTPKMLRLATGGDRRQWKRAWRLYFKLNGKLAPFSFFSAKISEAWGIKAASSLKDWSDKLYADWLQEAKASGIIPQ